MYDDFHSILLVVIGFVVAFIIILLGWLIFDFGTALNIYIIFYLTVIEIFFIISFIVKFGGRKKKLIAIIIIPLLAYILIFL